MKRHWLLVGILAWCGLSLQAQEHRHEVNAFIGGYKSEFIQVNSGSGSFFNSLFGGLRNNDHEGDLYSLYEPHYSLKSGPVFTLSYNYIVNQWLRVGAQGNVGTLSGKFWYVLGNKPAEQFNEVMLSVLPQVKFCIPGARHFRIYAKAAAGVQFHLGNRLGKHPSGFAWDVVPFGAEWGGQRIYGNAELCIGSVICGGRIGVGYRF